jgi:hypothetical protein
MNKITGIYFVNIYKKNLSSFHLRFNKFYQFFKKYFCSTVQCNFIIIFGVRIEVSGSAYKDFITNKVLQLTK